MRIAIAQMGSAAGDFDRTVDRMVAQSRVAAEQGARLIAFPGPALTGPDTGALADNPEFFSDAARALGRLADELACPAVVPVVAQAGDGPFDEAVFVHDGKLVPLRLASGVARGEESDAAGDAVPGVGPIGLTHEGANFAIAFDRAGIDELKASGLDVDALLYLPMDGFSTDDESSALAPSVTGGSFVADAASLNAWVIAVGAVGGYDDQVFCGGSFVLAPWGELSCAMPSFEEGLRTVEVDLYSEGPVAQPVAAEPYQRFPFLWDALSLAVRDFLVAAGAGGGAVVTLAGDLASCVTAVLATDALGPTRVRALVPDLGDAAALSDARELARNLRLETRELSARDLATAARAMGLAEGAEGSLVRVLLESWARELGAVALSSADKTALALEAADAVGAGGTYAPLGDVYRTDVISLALQRNTVSPVIPAGAMARYSVPDLPGIGFAGITRESRVSAVDAIMLLSLEQGMPLSDVVEQEGNRELAEAALARFAEGELSRRTMPSFPVVSSRTLGEASIPVGCAWRDRYRSEDELKADEAVYRRFEDGAREVLESRAKALSEQGESQVADVMEMIRDLLASGGLGTEGSGVWDSGLFSDN